MTVLLMLDAQGPARLVAGVVSTDMNSLVFPSLLGLAGAACAVEAAILSRIEGHTVSPSDYQFLLVLCWLGTALSAGGAGWAIIVRTRSARKEIATLVIASCLAIVVLSFCVRAGALPYYIGVPMTLSPRHEGAGVWSHGSPDRRPSASTVAASPRALWKHDWTVRIGWRTYGVCQSWDDTWELYFGSGCIDTATSVGFQQVATALALLSAAAMLSLASVALLRLRKIRGSTSSLHSTPR